MNLEDKWRAEFCVDNDCTDMESRFDPCLVPEWNGYLNGRRKAQEEIHSKLDEKELTMLNILMRNEISAEMKRLENHSARPKNYLQELEILKGKLK